MANLVKNINFKQPKYLLPAILYFPLLVTGYLIIDLFNVEIAEKENKELKTTEYLNADLPEAQLKEGIGGKRDNVQKIYGNVRDFSALDNIESDIDSLRKKEAFDSRYTDEDLEQLAMNDSTQARLAEARERLNRSAQRGADMTADEFVKDLTPEERAKIDELRRKGLFDELDRELEAIRARGKRTLQEASAGLSDRPDLAAVDTVVQVAAEVVEEKQQKVVSELDEDAENLSVVKKVETESRYFNTLSTNDSQTSMIKAIIDEEVKAVDGSRVRLRLLDDIEVDDVLIRKGTYLYCTMSGFSKQRVKGKIESVMVNDDLYKISLSIYDTDGLEGLYVPSSTFRETAKEIGGQVMQTNMNVNDGISTVNSVTSWAAQAIQQGYQRASQAISKSIRKNKVRLKYGTQVYLVNSKKQKSQGKSREGERSEERGYQGQSQSQSLYGNPSRSRFLNGGYNGYRQ